jgi:MoaA/NifB/PqqE/SkfB family radical SAM enzyme
MSFKEKFLAKEKDISCISERPPFPKIVKIDTNSACNYKCLFCAKSNKKGFLGNVDYEFCQKILVESFEGGARQCALSHTGEPMLNQQLEDHILFAKKIGFEYVFINTNGYFVTPERGRHLIDSGLDSIKFSINSSGENYELIHGVDAYNRVIDNLKELYCYRNKKGSKCRIYVSFVATKYTIDELELVKTAVSDISDDFITWNANKMVMGGGGVKKEFDNYLDNGRDEFSYTFPCSQLFNNAYVSDGYLHICSQDFCNEGIVADLKNQSIVEAWNNEKFVLFRRDHLRKNIAKGSLCYNCLNNANESIKPLMENVNILRSDKNLEQDLHKRILILEGKNGDVKNRSNGAC